MTEKEEIIAAKFKFISILTTESELSEFREVMSVSERYFQISNPIFSFLENFWRYQDLFNNENFEASPNFNPKQFPADHIVMKRFAHSTEEHENRIRQVPMTMVHQLLRFYATFISVGAPIQVPFVSSKIREDIATGLLELTTTRNIPRDLFDAACLAALDGLFCRCFPKYLAIKGQSINCLKQLKEEHKELELKLLEESNSERTSSDTNNSTKKPEAKKSLFGIFARNEKFKYKNTRECMVQVLQSPKLYPQFSEFVKETHCEENLVCYESFIKLESKIRPSDTNSLCLERFLDKSVVSTNDPVPIQLVPLFLFFHHMFILPESPFEVNVSHNLRKEIEEKLVHVKEEGVMSGIFDGVIDHVLELLYVNSFNAYLKTIKE
ncbi:hypothetical protein HDV04_006308 [Boothiomyces sp. JEL0838]|nr:hypothetical protein HDV04_006308 [Boothiomyces sp. JEL0838]